MKSSKPRRQEIQAQQLRPTVATDLPNTGAERVDLLGHANLTTTPIDNHVDQERRAAGMPDTTDWPRIRSTVRWVGTSKMSWVKTQGKFYGHGAPALSMGVDQCRSSHKIPWFTFDDRRIFTVGPCVILPRAP